MEGQPRCCKTIACCRSATGAGSAGDGWSGHSGRAGDESYHGRQGSGGSGYRHRGGAGERRSFSDRKRAAALAAAKAESRRRWFFEREKERWFSNVLASTVEEYVGRYSSVSFCLRS